jgi:hypothetical protein
MRVDAEGRRGVRVAEAFADSSNGNAGFEEVRGAVVAEVVEPDALEAELIAQAHEAARSARVRYRCLPVRASAPR